MSVSPSPGLWRPRHEAVACCLKLLGLADVASLDDSKPACVASKRGALYPLKAQASLRLGCRLLWQVQDVTPDMDVSLLSLPEPAGLRAGHSASSGSGPVCCVCPWSLYCVQMKPGFGKVDVISIGLVRDLLQGTGHFLSLSPSPPWFCKLSMSA